MNLGSKREKNPSLVETKSEVYYPTLFVSGINKEGDLPDGEFTFTGKAKLVSKTETKRNGKETYSFEIEVMELTPTSKGLKSKVKDAGEALDDAFKVIESEKEEMDDE